MSTFSESAHALVSGHSDSSRRAAFDRFVAVGLPTTSDEVWRYAPLSDFSLDNFSLDAVTTVPAFTPFATALRSRAGVVVHIVNGSLVSVEGSVDGLSVTQEASSVAETADRYAGDAFALLNCALTPNVVSITVAAQAQIAQPVLVVNTTTAGASFPQLKISLGTSSACSIVEYVDAVRMPWSCH